MPTPPALTNEQRRQAYEKALKLRQERAEIKRFLAAGGDAVQRLGSVWHGMGAAQGMKVIDLLTALPGVGKPSALRLLADAGFKRSEKTTVRGTGPRQRERLFEALTKRSPR